MFDIVLNPAGAAGQAGKTWQKVKPLFVASGKDFRVHISHSTQNMHDIIHDLSVHQSDIVIIGGDGSFNEAINAVDDFDHVRLGLISAGSGNDLIRSLHVSKDPMEQAQTILKGNTVRFINVGEVTFKTRSDVIQNMEIDTSGYAHRRFVISAGIGFDANICHDAQYSKWKKVFNHLHLGRLIYLHTAIQIIASTKRSKAWITQDGNCSVYPQLLVCVVMNQPYEGGGFMFCPDADDQDDLLDCCIGDGLSQGDFFRIFPYALKGHHLKFKGIHVSTAKEVEIKTEEPMWVHTDGEVPCCSTHICIGLSDQKVRMLI